MLKYGGSYLVYITILASCGCSGPAAKPLDVNAPCIPPGPRPIFALASPKDGGNTSASGGTIIVETPAENPPFSSKVAFISPSGIRVAGSDLTSAVAPAGTPSPTGNAVKYFQSSYVMLQSGTAYRVSLDLTQYTNLPVDCRKSFTIDAGLVRAM